MIKYIGAIVGWFVGRGFFGAVIGYFIGSAIDILFINKSETQGGQNRRSFRDVFESATQQNVSPGDFELNLLSLASLVIKADGKISQNELDYARQYFVRAYGKERANATFRTFNEVIKNREISASRICTYLNNRTRYEVRLQILHFLFGIAQADGQVSQPEVNVLSTIAGYFRINHQDFESIKNMFVKKADSAYKILEIEKSASDDEVKKAFRTMAKKYHPDKLVNMDEAYKKGAEEKFRNVQEAYEQIQKERGM
ncbi:TerB family tellurite resistance protein [Dokdonia sp. Hel_I_53]|uniref:TerB family tellurite resistance protein n=1 Tax=Dokdonia sp. Hel_I_53 TaxID=1566287 RepID=UPI001199E0FD|nr:TerB family tellurite resistance protein [Dokdonia sp. Hel_I_53]TVZ52533.1 DnaJ like chaperone protein [Dokdonia sp. Hel_I_53]